MTGFWVEFVGWWQGKKTILGGTLVVVVAVVGVWFGKLDPVSALTLVGIGLSITGASAKANRHQAELLSALQLIAQAGAEERSSQRFNFAAASSVIANSGRAQ